MSPSLKILLEIFLAAGQENQERSLLLPAERVVKVCNGRAEIENWTKEGRNILTGISSGGGDAGYLLAPALALAVIPDEFAAVSRATLG
jgi:hypothetical protein